MSTPTEVKAEAIALHAMGHSCRKIERQLRAKFPGADIPNHATINRWVRIRPNSCSRLRNQYTTMRWWEAARRAAEIVHSHLDDIENMPFNRAMVAYDRMMDVAIKLERLNNQR